MVMAAARQWREAGVGERGLGRSLLQGLGPKGSSKSSGVRWEWRVGGGRGGGAAPPGGWAPACQAPTCLASLAGTHVLTSSPTSPRRWVTHSPWGVSGARRHTEASRWGWEPGWAPTGEGAGSSIWRRQT